LPNWVASRGAAAAAAAAAAAVPVPSFLPLQGPKGFGGCHRKAAMGGAP
jgi:hypothetical protein